MVIVQYKGIPAALQADREIQVQFPFRELEFIGRDLDNGQEFVSFTMDSWGTTMRYDFSKDNGETLTMINMSPDMKKIMVAKGTINGCDDYLTPECKHAVRYTVKDAKRFHECQKFVGHHFALVYGDYVEEVKAFAKECDLEVLEA